MAWYTTTTAAPKIRREYKKTNEVINITFKGLTIGSYTRTRTITTDAWMGLTQTAAQAICDSQAAGTNVVDVHIERENPAGAYSYVKTTDVAGAWG